VDKRFLVGVLTTRDADKTKRCLDSIDCKSEDNTENMISFWQKIATLDFTSSKTISIQ
jgi:hypothetical protein